MAKKAEQGDRILASVSTIKQIIDYDIDALKRWERDGQIKEDVHFVRINGQRRYVVPLMVDRVINWNDDLAHQRAINAWNQSLLSEQKLPKIR